MEPGDELALHPSLCVFNPQFIVFLAFGVVWLPLARWISKFILEFQPSYQVTLAEAKWEAQL
jgi:ATP/ADP translocase